jgi:hydrogenase maturation protein HypF
LLVRLRSESRANGSPDEANMALIRRQVKVSGIVQGVGFRPFVYRIAAEFSVVGWVRNAAGTVDLEVEGTDTGVTGFIEALKNRLPPLARIDKLEVRPLNPVGADSFEILESADAGGQLQPIPPDIATCQDCVSELFDPGDRRFGYPFINCTNCGPRFTIIKDIPYDRPYTTMSDFPLCDECLREYKDPLDRRFHAQPNACPVCGPHYWLEDADGKLFATEDVVGESARLLRAGCILAPRGLGGYHLACDATSRAAVDTLRNRKRRGHKPFAVMMESIDEIARHCEVGPAEREALQSPSAPIVVLLWLKEQSSIVPSVAQGFEYLGVMLPYTPFHHLLMRRVGRPLVMTSANLSEEPIATGNTEAGTRLAGIADWFVKHNREILTRCDDSVMFVQKDRIQPLRRARGYAPDSLLLQADGGELLACGAAEKNTFCLVNGQQAFISQHIGDLENVETLEHYEGSIQRFEKFFRTSPVTLVCDLHPDYLSTQYARKRARSEHLKLETVQHHHAHIASCMADNGIDEAVIGVAFDGTGYGEDGTIWGGEFLLCQSGGFERLGHLEQVVMPGGEAAIRRPYRMAAAWLLQHLELPVERVSNILMHAPWLGASEPHLISAQIRQGLNTPTTSSAGRLFDAVAAILNLHPVVDYEAQAAIALEMAATRCSHPTSSVFQCPVEDGPTARIKLGKMMSELLAEHKKGVSVEELALKFHLSIATSIQKMIALLSVKTGIRSVALSGGVFQNRLLAGLVNEKLESDGYKVYMHRNVPANDGGISFGQAAVTAARLAGGGCD